MISQIQLDNRLFLLYYHLARSIGQAVKTPPSHGGNRGSIPLSTAYGFVRGLSQGSALFACLIISLRGIKSNMGFRTLEINQAAELHIKNGQLEVTSKEGTILIPIEDLNQIMVHGANIRLSTMDLSILSRNKVGIVTLDEKYLPTAIVLPFEGHARQSKLMHAQVCTNPEKHQRLWMEIIRAKINNQARALSILGLSGSEDVFRFQNNSQKIMLTIMRHWLQKHISVTTMKD